MDLIRSQIILIQKVKSFIKKSEAQKLSVFKLGRYYFAPFGKSKGFAKIISEQNKLKGIILNLEILLKDIYRILFLGKFKIIQNSNKKNYKNIIVNWASSKDFDKNGNFKDKHFYTTSKNNSDIFWVLILIGDDIPNKISDNIALILNEKKNFNLKFLWDAIKKSLKSNNGSSFFDQISYFTILANFFYENIDQFIFKNTQKILMPYEGQPFQNAIFKKINKINKKIKTIGFLHSFPIGLPLNLIKRDGAPKKIIVSSDSQFYCLKKFLGWKSNEIKILPSTRLRISKKIDMKNKVFLPIKFESSEKIIHNLNILSDKLDINLSNLQIKNHPSCTKSKKHIKLIKKIKYALALHKKKKIIKNLSIFIGATGSVVEALERNVYTIHICENPSLELYSKKLWKFIQVQRINNYIYRYGSIGRNRLIKFGKNVNLYKKYLH